jgi:DNA-binding XRE family transcriptional regulator
MGPPLTPELVLQWADSHRERTGRWPSVKSGAVRGAAGENWRTVDDAIRHGYRRLRGDSSLALFLAEHRGARNKTNLRALTARYILRLADTHHQRTGRWPTMDSGPVADAGETWSGLDSALKVGSRGLPGGDSLARLLVRRREARNRTNPPQHSAEQILAWADAHHSRTGHWPNHRSGPIIEAPTETWAGINSAMRSGIRGLQGCVSLYRFLKECRQIPGAQSAARRSRANSDGRAGQALIRINFPPDFLARVRSGELKLKEVAHRCSVTTKVAARELRRAGVEPVRDRPKPWSERDAKVVAAYRGGKSLAATGEEFGLSSGRVKTILKRCRVPIRPSGPEFFVPDMSADDRRRFGARLRELRRAARFTQDRLVAETGLTQVTISALENGRQSPTKRTAVALARALEVGTKAFLQIGGERHTE